MSRDILENTVLSLDFISLIRLVSELIFSCKATLSFGSWDFMDTVDVIVDEFFF